MYIGTNLQEKTGLQAVIDELDFTLGISQNSIPYLTKYGIDFSDNVSKEGLEILINNAISKLSSGIRLVNLEVDSDSRQINMILNYNNENITKALSI